MRQMFEVVATGRKKEGCCPRVFRGLVPSKLCHATLGGRHVLSPAWSILARAAVAYLFNDRGYLMHVDT
jgi:hypothetical protein